MPRLIDDLRLQNGLSRCLPMWVDPRKAHEWGPFAKQIAGFIMDYEPHELPVIVADNVAEYLYRGTDQEDWSLDRDFPNVAPPYPQFWLEYICPKFIRSSIGDTDLTDLPTVRPIRMGWFITASPPENVVVTGAPEGVKWYCMANQYYDMGTTRSPQVTGPSGSCVWAVGEQGQILDVPVFYSYTVRDGGKLNQISESFMALLQVPFLTLSFMHCKNVAVETNTPSKAFAKRYAQRNNGHRLMPTRTLVIEPMKKVLRSAAAKGKGNRTKEFAMHIQRGKFWDYREGPGMFGKINALVWHEARVRGTKGNRPAARQVEVKAPA